MTKKKFTAHSVRTISSPSDPDVTTYYAWVSFADLPSDIAMDVNPRKPKMTTAVAKQLINAVKSPDTDFDINNRGIVITAKSVRYNTTSRELEVDLGDDVSRYGILDGGHTYKAIIDNRDSVAEKNDKYVKLEIVVGNNLDVSALADARNTSVQVSDIALFELDDKFEFIKNAIKNQPYAKEVAYKDNDNKRIEIAELLKLMYAFNIYRFPNDNSAPVASYSGKATVFKDYKNSYASKSNIYENLAPQIPLLVDLFETIEIELPQKYSEFKRENGTKSKFGRVRGIDGSGNYETTFTQKKMAYQISLGFIMPIFGAFRALLQADSQNNVSWAYNPLDVWNDVGTRLVQNTFETDTNPQQAGKSKVLWQSNYRIVDGQKKDLTLKALTKLVKEQKH